MIPFTAWPKIPRLSREIIITEKLDGTNASIFISPRYTPEGAINAAGAVAESGDFLLFAGSRNRWITPENDNYGFAAWARDNKGELLKLGPGHHFGEWWGKGIQRGYGLNERRFSLFNTKRWAGCPVNNFQACSLEDHTLLVKCCSVVPVLWSGLFCSGEVKETLHCLKVDGSRAAPGFMDPEGIIIYHVAGGHYYKKTVKDDESPKTLDPFKDKIIPILYRREVPDPFQVLSGQSLFTGDKLADNPENQ